MDVLYENSRMIEIKIPFKTPTINHLYWHRGNIKIMTKEAKEIRKKIFDCVVDSVNMVEEDWIEGSKLKVEVGIHENWFTKKGEVKRKDISNREKFLIDSVFAALDVDDKFIFKHTMKKVQSEEEFAMIRIRECSSSVV